MAKFMTNNSVQTWQKMYLRKRKGEEKPYQGTSDCRTKRNY